MKLFASIIFTCVIFITLSAQNSIIGGIIPEEEQFPWMASIVMGDTGAGFEIQGCGATLIAPEWILTAGHCIIDQPGFLTVESVVINTLHLNQDSFEIHTELIDIEETYVHENYSDFFNGGDGTGPDIALIKLSEPSMLTPIVLADFSDSTHYAHGMPGITMGWGITEIADSSDSLLYANVSIYGDQECADAFNNGGYYAYNAGGNICAGYFAGTPVSGAGSGDSGGPLLFMDTNGDYKQVGIVSGGNGSVTMEDSPGVFTFIPQYRDWINNIIDPDATSISTFEEEDLSIQYFANNSLLVSDLNSNDEYQVNLFDLSGRAIFQGKLNLGTDSHTIETQQLLSGFYVLEIRNLDKGLVSNYKFVVNR